MTLRHSLFIYKKECFKPDSNQVNDALIKNRLQGERIFFTMPLQNTVKAIFKVKEIEKSTRRLKALDS